MNRAMWEGDEWTLLFLRVEEFGEARILLKEREVLVIARVVAIGAIEADGDFQVGHGRVGFAGEAVEGGKRIDDVVGFGGELSRCSAIFRCMRARSASSLLGPSSTFSSSCLAFGNFC